MLLTLRSKTQDAGTQDTRTKDTGTQEIGTQETGVQRSRPVGLGRFRRRRRGARRLKASALLASAVSVCLLAAGAPPAPVGVGDRLFPYLGNPGSAVDSSALSFPYPGSHSKPLQAVTRINA